jgi:hypothetical protein
MDRKQLIREAARRAAEPKPEGRWVRLEDVMRSPTYEARGGASRRANSKYHENKARSRSGWVVLYPGVPQVGQKIRINKASGGKQERYVQQVVVSAVARGDGRSVVAVSKSPVMPPPSTQPPMESIPAPKPPPLLKQRNPRICEACEGPCRPGAGMCDQCRTRPPR